jgi:hypothetical protein
MGAQKQTVDVQKHPRPGPQGAEQNGGRVVGVGGGAVGVLVVGGIVGVVVVVVVRGADRGDEGPFSRKFSR